MINKDKMLIKPGVYEGVLTDIDKKKAVQSGKDFYQFIFDIDGFTVYTNRVIEIITCENLLMDLKITSEQWKDYSVLKAMEGKRFLLRVGMKTFRGKHYNDVERMRLL